MYIIYTCLYISIESVIQKHTGSKAFFTSAYKHNFIIIQPKSSSGYTKL